MVYYYLPQDEDDTKTFNAFGIQKNIEDIRLTDVKNEFPLPGEYYFRFKYKHADQIVWMDITNEDVKLPRFDGKLIVKVTRMSWGSVGIGSNAAEKVKHTVNNLNGKSDEENFLKEQDFLLFENKEPAQTTEIHIGRPNPLINEPKKSTYPPQSAQEQQKFDLDMFGFGGNISQKYQNPPNQQQNFSTGEKKHEQKKSNDFDSLFK